MTTIEIGAHDIEKYKALKRFTQPILPLLIALITSIYRGF